MAATKTEFVAQARTWLDVPYHHQGYSRYGADCIGFVIGAALELGLDWRPFDIPNRSRYSDGYTFENQVRKVFTPTNSPEPGDLLLFRIHRHPQHCALLTDKGMIHAYESIGKVVETDYTQRWRSLLVQAFVLPLN